jgi:hypothetical protein
VLEHAEFDPCDVDRELDRIQGTQVSRKARPEEGSFDWYCEEGALFAAWMQWAARIKEFRGQRRGKEAPKGWFSRQQRRFCDSLCDEYGHWAPDGDFLNWRQKRLNELGRHEDAKLMDGRMPWE